MSTVEDQGAKAVSLQELAEWDEAQIKEPLNMAEMRKLISDLAKQDAQCAEIDELKKQADKAYDLIKDKILGALKAAGEDSFRATGIGLVSKRAKYSVSFPSSLTDKKKLFNWIRETHGGDSLLGMVSIHSGKFNSFFNEQMESARAKKEALEMPGVAAPTLYESISFTKEKPKKED